MLKYDKDTNAISIIAKDTGDFIFSLTNYTLSEGDIVYFTVNDELEKPDPKIQKEIISFPSDGKILIRLNSEDTNIPVGNYYYDIEIKTIDGRTDTVLGPAKFKVMGGVKY